MTAGAALEIDDLETGYQAVPIVHGVSVRFEAGRLTALIGPNGAGKSTVLKAAVGLLPAWRGRVRVFGVDVTREPAYRRVSRGVAYVPQGRTVFATMTVGENLELGAFAIRADRAAVERARETVYRVFPRLAERRQQITGTMSGGERQMVAIGRALMTSPRVILLDEPSLGLSPKNVGLIFEVLDRLRGDGYTIGIVEQKASLALARADHAYVLSIGRVMLTGRGPDLAGEERVRRLFLGEVPEDAHDGSGDPGPVHH